MFEDALPKREVLFVTVLAAPAPQTPVAVVGEKSPRADRNVRIFIGELQASPFELVVRDGVSGLAGVKVVGVASLDGVARAMAGTKTLDTTSASLAPYVDGSILRDAAQRLRLPMRTPEYGV